MSMNAGIIEKWFADDGSAANEIAPINLASTGDSVNVRILQKMTVYEIGIFVTTDIVPGDTGVECGVFRRTTASIRDSSEGEATAPSQESAATGRTAGRDIAIVDNTTVPDGRVLSKKVDFTLEKGETILFTASNAVSSGAGVPYLLAYPAGEGKQEPGCLIAENSDTYVSGSDIS